MQNIQFFATFANNGMDNAQQQRNPHTEKTRSVPRVFQGNRAGCGDITFQIIDWDKWLSPETIKNLDSRKKQTLLFQELGNNDSGETLPADSPVKSFRTWLKRAEHIMLLDKDYPKTIIAAYSYQTRPLTDIEVAALIIHYRSLHSHLAEAVDRLAKVEAQKLLTEMEATERILRSINTESDSGLVVREMALALDYSLTGLTLKATAAKGEKLNPREQKEIARIAKEFKRLQGEQARTDRVDKAIEEEQPKKKRNKKNASKAQLSKVQALKFGTKTIVDDTTD